MFLGVLDSHLLRAFLECGEWARNHSVLAIDFMLGQIFLIELFAATLMAAFSFVGIHDLVHVEQVHVESLVTRCQMMLNCCSLLLHAGLFRRCQIMGQAVNQSYQMKLLINLRSVVNMFRQP